MKETQPLRGAAGTTNPPSDKGPTQTRETKAPPPANVFQTPHPSVTVNESVVGWPLAARCSWNVDEAATLDGTYVFVP